MKLNPFKKDKTKKEVPKADVSVSEKKEIMISDPGAYKVLASFYVSEKASLLTNINQYVFRIRPMATKSEIYKKVEKLFNVKVKDVKIVKLPGKTRHVGRYTGKTNTIKKAIVILHKGYSIDQAKS